MLNNKKIAAQPTAYPNVLNRRGTLGNLYAHIQNARSQHALAQSKTEKPQNTNLQLSSSQPKKTPPRYEGPQFLPIGIRGGKWKVYPSKAAFYQNPPNFQIYSRKNTEFDGKFYVIQTDDSGTIPCRDVSWATIAGVTDIPQYLPVADAKSSWVYFLSRDGFSHLPVENVFESDEGFWVNLHHNHVPDGEFAINTRQHNWADHLGINTRPGLLPKGPEGSVWVPFPNQTRVPPNAVYYTGLSGKKADGIFWVLYPSPAHVPKGERYFECRSRSYADELGIKSLPRSLPVGPSDSVWAPYPSEAIFKSTKRSYFPNFTMERDGVYWVLHPNISCVIDGEHYFPSRQSGFTAELEITTRPKSLPSGPPDSVWVPFPDLDTFKASVGSLAITVCERQAVVWALLGSVSQVPYGESYFSANTVPQAKQLGITSYREDLPHVPDGIWIPYSTADYIPIEARSFQTVQLASDTNPFLQEYWVCYPDFVSVDRWAPIEQVFVTPPPPATPDVTQLTSDRLASWATTLPKINKDALWFVYTDKASFDLHYASYFPTQMGYIRDGYWIAARPNSVGEGTEIMRLMPRLNSYAKILGISSPPKSLPLGPEGSSWVPFPSIQALRSVDRHAVLFKTTRDAVLWGLFGTSTQVPSGETYFESRSKSWVKSLEITSLPASLPDLPKDGIWVPCPTREAIPPEFESYPVYSINGILWVAVPSKNILASVLPCEDYFLAKIASAPSPMAAAIQSAIPHTFTEQVNFYQTLQSIRHPTPYLEWIFANRSPVTTLTEVTQTLHWIALGKSLTPDTILELLDGKPSAEWASITLAHVSDAALVIAKIPIDSLLQRLQSENPDWPTDTIDQIKTIFEAIHTQLSIIKRWDGPTLKAWAGSQAKLDPIETQLAAIAQSVFLTKGYYPRATQFFAVIGLIQQPNRFGEIHTGEGKTDIVRMLAAWHLLNGRRVDIVTSSPILANRDADDSKPFFDHFNLSTAHVCDRQTDEAAYQADVTFGDSASYQFAILGDINSGTTVRGNRVFETVIVDEVDAMLLDGGDHIAYIASDVPELENSQWLYRWVWNQFSKIQEAGFESAETQFKQTVQEQNIIDLFPSHLQSFIGERLKSWPQKIKFARFQLTRNKDYTINESDEISPVDFSNTGVVNSNQTYSGGVHQFLSLKEGCTVKPERLIGAFISNMAFFKLYATLYGVSGTLGNETEKKELADVYGVGFFKIPTFKEKQVRQFDTQIHWSAMRWIESIAKSAQYHALECGKPVLIIFETIQQTKAIRTVFQALDIDTICIDGTESHTDRNQLVNTAGNPGSICIATNIAGRGMDISPSSTALKNGGLHLIRTYIEKNNRVERQALGRTGRNGNLGTCELIIYDPDSYATTVAPDRLAVLEKNRDDRYHALAVERHQFSVPKTRLKDLAFLQMAQILGEVAAIKNDTIRNLPNGFNAMWDVIKPYLSTEETKPSLPTTAFQFTDAHQRNAAKSRWRDWVSLIDQIRAESTHESATQLRHFFDQFVIFVRALKADFDAGTLIRDPMTYVKIGLETTSLRAFDQAIKLAPDCIAAHYHKAWHTIRGGNADSGLGHLKATQVAVSKTLDRLRRIATQFDGESAVSTERTFLTTFNTHLEALISSGPPDQRHQFVAWHDLQKQNPDAAQLFLMDDATLKKATALGLTGIIVQPDADDVRPPQTI